MIPMRDLDDDFYMFDEENYCLVGHYTKKKYQLGDNIQIKIARANIERKQLDFVLSTSEKHIETDPEKADALDRKKAVRAVIPGVKSKKPKKKQPKGKKPAKKKSGHKHKK